MEKINALYGKLSENIHKVIVGKDETIKLLYISLLCGGHILIEDVPGTGKTMLVKSFSASLDCVCKRIQFTPDLMPSDITGINYYNMKTTGRPRKSPTNNAKYSSRYMYTPNEPLFPFGYGLSYTTFELAKPKILSKGKVKTLTDEAPLKVAIEVNNTGAVAGAEVVQLYIAEKNPTVLRPNKELKAFRKVTVEPGKKAVVTFEVDKKMCSYWCDKNHAWTANAGEYEILIGTSSADIVAVLPFVVK